MDNHGVAGETDALTDNGEPVLPIRTSCDGIVPDELPVNISAEGDGTTTVPPVTINVTGTETTPFAELGEVTKTVP